MKDDYRRYALSAIAFIGLGFAAFIIYISTSDYLSLRSFLSLNPSIGTVAAIASRSNYSYLVIILSTLPVIAFSLLLLSRSLFNRRGKRASGAKRPSPSRKLG
ncbi:hypothetical protein M1293_03695 [Candidatus Parvarchaeota archaeon]|nr:hypothetical protein [Candidatus Parvarchaeota archaeon]